MSSFNISQILPCIQKQQFSQCIGQLTYLIENTTQNSVQNRKVSEALSTLFLNRGIMEIYEGRLDQSLEDLQKSIEYNHLNYASYFNIFSVKHMNFERLQSFKQLCCSLSCLYLLRGRLRNAQVDINKAVKYCENNLEARIAKSLNFFKKKKFNLALNEIKWVLDIQPDDEKSRNICNKLQKLLEIDSQSAHQKNNTELETSALNNNSLRLSFSLYDEEELQTIDIEKQIASKILEFNELYLQLNGEPLVLLNKTSPRVYLLYKNVNFESFGNLSSHQQLFSALSIPEIPHTGRRQINEGKVQGSESLIEENQGHGKDMADNFGEISSVKLQEPESSQYYEQYYSTSRDNTSLESGLTLQVEGDKNLSVKVINIDIPDKDKLFTQLEKSNLYCLFEYGHKSFTSLESSHTWDHQNWQTSFETELQNQPQILTVKVFNKELKAFHDTLLGEGHKELVSIGRLTIPILKKDNNQSQQIQIGNVLLEVKYK